MKTDSYTKAVLTVIAIALITLVCQNLNVVPTVNASTPFNTTKTMDVNIVSVSENLFPEGKIKVEIINSPTVKINNDFMDVIEIEIVKAPEIEIKNGYNGIDINVTNHDDFE